jgi:hypothetical protein
MIKLVSYIQKALPAQLSSDKEANAKLATLKDTMESGSNTIVIGTFVTNLLLSASLSLLWGMINTMQIIGNMPNFNLFIPANVESFFTFI